MFTQQQQAVIDAFRRGESMAIRSVAGSGKTTTLVGCFQHAPESSLSVAFNKRNAEDLASKMPKHVVSKTMNALGHAAWMRHTGKRMSVETDKLFKMLKAAPFYKDLGESAMDVLRLVRLAKSFGIASGWNNSKPDTEYWLDIADEYDIEDGEGLLDHAIWLLQESCKTAFQGQIDFDDQIYMPILYGSPFKKFSCVAVDEAQDLSSIQHKMIERSLAPSGQIIVVGDPNQAIYAWRGASNNSFHELVSKFSLSTKNLTLSFRCPRAVVAEAQKYVPDIEAASDTLGSVQETEASIEPQSGVTVLSRTNAPLIKLAFRALRERQAINYSGKDFLSGLKTLNKKYPTMQKLEAWKKNELAKTDKPSKITRIEDRFAALEVLHSTGDVKGAIEQLTRTPPEKALTLSTIHKAKGSEWDRVIYLDYWREWPGTQEANVKYVGVTRAKQSLLLHLEKSSAR